MVLITLCYHWHESGVRLFHPAGLYPVLAITLQHLPGSFTSIFGILKNKIILPLFIHFHGIKVSVDIHWPWVQLMLLSLSLFISLPHESSQWVDNDFVGSWKISSVQLWLRRSEKRSNTYTFTLGALIWFIKEMLSKIKGIANLVNKSLLKSAGHKHLSLFSFLS